MEDPRPEGRPPASVVSRVLFFLAGLVALAVGTIITLGAALAGAVSIGIVAMILRRKKRRITRRGAWLASVGGTIVALALFFGISVLRAPSVKPPTAAERAEQRQRATEAMPDWLKAMNPNAQKQSQAADSMAAALLDNKAVMVWAGLMATVIAAGLMGTIAGSFAWGGVMLLSRSFSGDWLPAATPGPTGL
jgi:hypothetical protein